MVTQFLRLKLRLLENSFRRSPLQLIGMLVGLACGVGGSVLAAAGLIELRLVDSGTAGSVVVVFGSLVVLGFLGLPLAFGINDTLDPRRFALFGIPSAQLARGLLLSALAGIPALMVTIIAAAQVITWSQNFGSVFLAVVSAAVIIVTCVLGARVTTSLASFLLASRGARELTGIVALTALILLSPVISVLISVDWGHDGLNVLGDIAQVAGWTPLGAAWAAPADAVAGNLGAALLKAAIGIAFAAILWFAWRALVATMLVAPQRQAESRRYVGLGWFDQLPANPTGAIAARSLTYWNRDARYRVSLVVIPIVPFLWIVPLVIAGASWQDVVLIPVPIMCLFAAWSIHNDVAYDNTAFWLHVASNTAGRADRGGRIIPTLIFGVPLILIGCVFTVWLHGDWSIFPSMIGLCSCIFFAGLGVSSIISARFPYPTVRPGDSPFHQPQFIGSRAALIQSLSFFAIVLVSAPVLALGILGFMFGGEWNLLTLLVGVVIGGIGLLGGVAAGSRIFNRRAPELLAFALRN